MRAVKYSIGFFICFCWLSTARAQNFESPAIAFNQAANEYIYESTGKAVQTLNKALQQYPNDEKLTSLLEKILKDKKEQQQQQQNQQNQDNQQQDQKQKQEQKQQQQQEQQQNAEQADEEKDAEEKNEGDPQTAKEGEENKEMDENAQIKENLEDMNISVEKAQMILDAMKNNEMQYLQQMQRKPTQRTDPNKPDW